MNRENFLVHLLLAVMLILLAAFAGQVSRWLQNQESERERAITRLEAERREQAGAEVLVRFRSETPWWKIREIARSLNDRVEDHFEAVNGLTVIADKDGLDAETVAAEYRALGELVEYAEPNIRIDLEPVSPIRRRPAQSALRGASDQIKALFDGPNDPMFSEQWSLNNTGQRGGKNKADIDALQAWTRTRGSSKVIVAVLDSGVDYTHPDLISNIWVRPAHLDVYTDDHLGIIDDRHGYNAVTNSGDPMDDNGHGTHCAGIVGAEGGNDLGIAGVNWEIQIMPLKFMNANGSGTTKDAIEAINYVIDRKRAGVNVRVINASWGSPMRSRALEDAIRKAGEEGILFVAAAGNSSTDADRLPQYPAGYDLPNVISVAALNRNDELASFSNYGAKRVHIAAPGVEILSTWLRGGFEEHSGTSMASPVVAGVAALILSIEPDIPMGELRRRLLRSADPLESLNGKVSSGGRLNAAKSVGIK